MKLEFSYKTKYCCPLSARLLQLCTTAKKPDKAIAARTFANRGIQMNIFANFLPEYMHFNAIDSANLILMLSIILLLGAMGGRLFQKLKIPQVVGYIVIGIIIGQSGLQLLRKEVITALDPVSQIALSLIGFLIGGELKLGVLKKYGKQFIGILLFEAIIPFIEPLDVILP